jgi:hypothetical protein
MQKLQFKTRGGQPYKVNLPEPAEGIKSAYLFSYHKSGSTLMDNMVRHYCRQIGVPTFSLFNMAFDSGVTTSEIMEDALVCFSKTGRIYTGFRHYPRCDLELTGVPCIMLVRDPRDMLVSMYYSIAKSHVVPSKNVKLQKSRQETVRISVDEFALKKAGDYLRRFNRYQRKLPADTLTTYRYEDVIYAKEDWLTDLVKQLSLRHDKALVKEIAKQFDIFPEQEEQGQHIRQVHPGNYKTKLKPETIEKITEVLEGFLHHYNYV